MYTRLRDLESLKINPNLLSLVDSNNDIINYHNTKTKKINLPKTALNNFITTESTAISKFTNSPKLLRRKWLKHKFYLLIKSNLIRCITYSRPSNASYMTKKSWRVFARFLIRKRLPLLNSLSSLKLSSTSLSSDNLVQHPQNLNVFIKKIAYLNLKTKHRTTNSGLLKPLIPRISFSTNPKQMYFHKEFYMRESLFNIRSRTCLAGGSWNFKRFTRYLFTDAYSTYGGTFFTKWLKISTQLVKKRRYLKSNNLLSSWKRCKSVLEELHQAYSYNYTSWFFSEPVRVFVKRHNSTTVHNLVLKFNQHQFFISLLDPAKRLNYFSLLPGLLLKHIEGSRKSAKKALTTKLLLMRFLRKLLIVSRIRNLTVIVKGIPLFIVQLFTFLNNPLTHVIKDPFTKKIIDETGDNHTIFNYFHLFFLRPKPYGYQKTRKKGRVKRKIRRKIARSARVIDEF